MADTEKAEQKCAVANHTSLITRLNRIDQSQGSKLSKTNHRPQTTDRHFDFMTRPCLVKITQAKTKAKEAKMNFRLIISSLK